ncbi:MAG TPA: SAM-dependent methyltransferase, partial [Caulobacteraceae bacterium]|nr:SAM-dependent methyltransferase [Caulobacteraceae bacterium]
PPRVCFVEMGPGDGTLMADALRAARAVPGFLGAAELVLIETSAPLRDRQAVVLAASSPRWAVGIDEIGTDCPVIILANEVLDCLPIRQAVRTADGWRERRVGRRGFEAAESVSIPLDGPLGAIFEFSPATEALGREVRALLARAGGAALFIDYGRPGPEFADTLQAVRDHAKECPLAHPGLADLTAHVDFSAFAPGARVLTQGEFLRALGIESRAATLAGAHPAEAAKIGRQLARLTDSDQMGELFKVVGLAQNGLALPGLED